MLLLGIATWGLYSPIWFLRRRKALNRLGGNIRVWPFVTTITLLIIAFYLYLTGDSSSRFLRWPAGIIILVQGLNVRDILENASQEEDKGRLSFVLTFIIGILYLQYKINRMDSLGARTPALGSRMLLWSAAGLGLVGFFGVMMLLTRLDSLADQVSGKIRDLPVIVEHIGSIESVDLDWTATDNESRENLLVFRIKGDKAEGMIVAEVRQNPHSGNPPHAFGRKLRTVAPALAALRRG